MKATGIKIRRMLMEGSLIVLVSAILANGNMIRPVELVLIITLMDQFMLVNGKMISNMVLDKKLGKTSLNMKGNFRMDKDMGLALFIFLIILNMLESFI